MATIVDAHDEIFMSLNHNIYENIKAEMCEFELIF